MKAVASWPPVASDMGAVVEAYERVLCWPLLVETTLLSWDRAAAELRKGPGSLLSTTCSAMDTVTVPREVGLETMVLLGRRDMGPVPCLISPQDQATLLIRAGTGNAFAGMENIRVESGAGERLILPPSSGWRWDTPPWDARTRAPCPLLDGTELVGCVRDALRLFGGCVP
ncbi:hypothetical protein [Streptomyces sp. MMS24-I29]|uniref:hypothetical protein n=1 Tax=Streptomyces sp. MMS24-I29 TaxID=3351480 RepID=UPI003C7AA3D5